MGMLLLHIYLFECYILLINCDYQFIFIDLFMFQSSLILHTICPDCYTAWYGPQLILKLPRAFLQVGKGIGNFSDEGSRYLCNILKKISIFVFSNLDNFLMRRILFVYVLLLFI